MIKSIEQLEFPMTRILAPTQLIVVTILACCALGCERKQSETDLRGWHRVETLWRSRKGTEVALYEWPDALSRNGQSVVCETERSRKLIVLSGDTFPLVSGDYVNIFNLENRTTPGWYKIERNHRLNWWQRTFSDESLGGWRRVKGQAGLDVPAPEVSRGGIYAREGGQLRRIAEESHLNDLFGAPARVSYTSRNPASASGLLSISQLPVPEVLSSVAGAA